MSKNDNIRKPLYTYLPSGIKEFLITTAGIGVFIGLFFKIVWKRPHEWQEMFRQSFLLGYKTLMLVSITGFIMGLVMTLQSEPILETFGAESWLPSMVSISIFRELGPVIAGLICAGKIGSGIGAELGSMKVTEQIDAMEVSGTNPFNFLVVTRVLATTLTVPLLVFYADAVALLGSFIAVNFNNNMELNLFLSLALDPMLFSDVIPATIKSILFGFAIGIVSCYMGYQAERGTESVGIAANRAVVASSLCIFLIDLVAVEVTNLFLY